MDELVLSPAEIEKIEVKDRVFARKLDESRRSIVQFIRQVQPYISAIAKKMQAGDLYRACVSKSVLDQLKKGELEKVLKSDSGLWTGIIRKADGSKIFETQTQWQPISFDPNIVPDLFRDAAMQAAIAEVTEQLFVMNEKLDLIVCGQHFDRIALIESAIDQYQVACDYKDQHRRENQLDNSLNMLNEGRRKLIKEIDAMLLTHGKRDERVLDKLWRKLGIDRVEAERFEKIHADVPPLVRNLRYINIGSAYIARIHVVRNEPDAAQRSLSQFAEFTDGTLKAVDVENTLYPNELRNGVRELVTLSNGAIRTWIDGGDLIVDATYEELLP